MQKVKDIATDVDLHGTRVIIEKKADEDRTAGGLYLGEGSKTTFETYTVVKCGTDQFSPADVVVCQGMGPQILPEDVFGERMFYIEQEDIIATVRLPKEEPAPTCETIEETTEEEVA